MIVDWPLWALIVLTYIIGQRLLELVYANANTRRLLAEGGKEHGAKHYPLFILLHSGWLVAIALFANPDAQPKAWLLCALFLSQIFRFWTLWSIGRWWTTRIISAPHFPRIKRGPYLLMAHPNYTVVVIEIAVLPLLLGAPEIAILFSLLNAGLLWWRIKTEGQVLTERE